MKKNIMRKLVSFILVSALTIVLFQVDGVSAADPSEVFKPDDYAGYVYVCFSCENLRRNSERRDVQQVHFYLSRDGLNWTSLNGNKPAFTAGKQWQKYVEPVSWTFMPERAINYDIKEDYISDEYWSYLNFDFGTVRYNTPGVMHEFDIEKTVTGDASALFPYEGSDQGIRDPYIIRGCKKDGSDKDKIWVLATDLNTMRVKYGNSANNNNFKTSTVGNWGIIASEVGSRNIFVYETSDKMKTWTRRWVDLGSSEKLSESLGATTDKFFDVVWRLKQYTILQKIIISFTGHRRFTETVLQR